MLRLAHPAGQCQASNAVSQGLCVLHWHAWCRVRRLLTWVHPFWDLEAKEFAASALDSISHVYANSA